MPTYIIRREVLRRFVEIWRVEADDISEIDPADIDNFDLVDETDNGIEVVDDIQIEEEDGDE